MRVRFPTRKPAPVTQRPPVSLPESTPESKPPCEFCRRVRKALRLPGG
jgi:hypothetical protein